MKTLTLLTLAIGLSILCRVTPYLLEIWSFAIYGTWYPWNFSPLLPLTIFAIAQFGVRGWLIPIATFLLGDLLIGFITNDWVLFGLVWQPTVWLAIVAAGLWGYLLTQQPSTTRVLTSGLGAATSFFITSNLGVWLFSEMYPLTWAGLTECFYLALPFYRNTLISMVVCLPILFHPAFSIPRQAMTRRTKLAG